MHSKTLPRKLFVHNKNVRVVITGGAGFLGSHLADRILAEGHKVVIVDNFVTGSRTNVAHLHDNANAQVIEQDVSVALQIGGEVDYVAHFASPASPDDFTRIPLQVMRSGSHGTENCLNLCALKGAKFIFASTSEVYGDPAISPQPESYWGNVNPNGIRSVYDEAKRFGEAMTMAFHSTAASIPASFDSSTPTAHACGSMTVEWSLTSCRKLSGANP